MKYLLVFVLNTILLPPGMATDRYLSISGMVTGPSGEGIPRVMIQLIGADHTTTSDDRGHFMIDNLRPGTFYVQFSHIGFMQGKKKVLVKDGPVDLGIIALQAVDYTIKEVHIQAEGKRALSLPADRVGKAFIARHAGGSLMETLSRLPGVGHIGIGAGQSKPLIRGLGFNRVVVADKGIKHEGQQWGLDHGLEIDQFATGTIEVVKGPASFLYGSDAIGGVVDIRPEPLAAAGTLSGAIDLLGRSNNRLYGSSAHLKGRSGAWAYGVRISYQNAGDYRVPTDTVHVYNYPVRLHGRQARNTAGRELNLHAHAGYIGQHAQSVLYLSHHRSKSGFFANAHGLEPRRVDTVIHDASSRDLQWPHQQVHHLKLISRTSLSAGRHTFELDVGYQHNFRQEHSPYVNHGYMPPIYPEDLAIPTDLERQYDKRIYSLQVRDQIVLGRHRLTGGLSSEYQHNGIGGWSFLTPAFRQGTAGLFVYDQYTLSPHLSLDAAARYDHGQIHTATYTDWFASVVRDTPGGQETARLVRSENLHRSLSSFTWSLGGRYSVGGFFLDAHIGKSFRMPIAKELAANGVNYHYFSYELGDSTLSPEVSYQADLGLRYAIGGFRVALTPFYNYFSNYIYLNPTPRHDHFYGAGNQIFEYTQARVIRYGGELKATYPLSSSLRTEITGEYVYARQLSGKKHGYTLPFSPPSSLLATLSWEPKDSGTWAGSYFSVDLQLVSSQNHIVPPEKNTPGYRLIHLQVGHTISVQRMPVTIRLQVRNVLDTSHLSHTSFYRLIELPELGRDLVLSLSVPFDIKKKQKQP